jgi:hypothetical protein
MRAATLGHSHTLRPTLRPQQRIRPPSGVSRTVHLILVRPRLSAPGLERSGALCSLELNARGRYAALDLTNLSPLELTQAPVLPSASPAALNRAPRSASPL